MDSTEKCLPRASVTQEQNFFLYIIGSGGIILHLDTNVLYARKTSPRQNDMTLQVRERICVLVFLIA